MAQVIRGYRLGELLSVAVTENGGCDAVGQLLGTPLDDLTEPPDIVVRRSEAPIDVDRLRMIDTTVGFDDDRFVVVQRPTSVVVELGAPLELTFHGDSLPTSLLLLLLDAAALRKRLVPLPGAVLSFGGRGIALLGWPHSGKTSAVLALLGAGAGMVSDDRAYARLHPSAVVGVHKPLEIRGHHRAALGELSALTTRDRLRLAATAMGSRGASVVADRPWGGHLASGALRLSRALEAKAVLTVEPSTLGQTGSGVERIDVTFLLVRHRGKDTIVESMPAAVARHRFAALAQHDLAAVRNLGFRYSFALPGRGGEEIVELAAGHLDDIARFADDVPFYAVYHSSHEPQDLLAALQPYCS